MNEVDDISWWPDFVGRTVAILAAGPSITKEQCDMVRAAGMVTIAINETWRLATWADIHYICDWQYAKAKIPRPEAYAGMRVIGTWPKHTPIELKRMENVLHRIEVRAGTSTPIWDGHRIGAGGNSAFQMTNWARRCGARDIILLGVDCHTPNMHWHGSHDHIEKPIQRQVTLDNWIRGFKKIAMDPRMHNVVTNCSPGTALRCFPYVPLTTVITRMKDAA